MALLAWILGGWTVAVVSLAVAVAAGRGLEAARPWTGALLVALVPGLPPLHALALAAGLVAAAWLPSLAPLALALPWLAWSAGGRWILGAAAVTAVAGLAAHAALGAVRPTPPVLRQGARSAVLGIAVLAFTGAVLLPDLPQGLRPALAGVAVVLLAGAQLLLVPVLVRAAAPVAAAWPAAGLVGLATAVLSLGAPGTLHALAAAVALAAVPAAAVGDLVLRRAPFWARDLLGLAGAAAGGLALRGLF